MYDAIVVGGTVCGLAASHASGTQGISGLSGGSGDLLERHHLFPVDLAAGRGMPETMGTPGSSPCHQLSAGSGNRVRSWTVPVEGHTTAGRWHFGNVRSAANGSGQTSAGCGGGSRGGGGGGIHGLGDHIDQRPGDGHPGPPAQRARDRSRPESSSAPTAGIPLSRKPWAPRNITSAR